MLRFYKKAILIFAGLIAFTLASAFICRDLVLVRDDLLPAGDSVIPWEFDTITDAYRGGTSSMSINDSSRSLDYDYVLTRDVPNPHVTAIVSFTKGRAAGYFVDLREYSTVAFRIKCVPRNILSFHLHSFDPKATVPENFYSYRLAKAFFSCNDEWSNVEIDLRYLYIPEWWQNRFKIEVSDQGYRLDQVAAFSIAASFEGPIKRTHNTPASIKISEMSFQGRDWRYAWLFGGLSVLVWAYFIFWLFKQYTRSLIASVKDKLQKDLALIAYRDLSSEPQTDREKVLLLRFMATKYADPDLSLEKISAVLGINRAKINEILKNEFGLTFTACLNKLRLTEAARLLSENDKANVAEIAYSVGYNNLTYFIRLFKNEYGCPPKAFKSIFRSDISEGRLPGSFKHH
jgi:AraC-like DNA-binding protein